MGRRRRLIAEGSRAGQLRLSERGCSPDVHAFDGEARALRATTCEAGLLCVLPDIQHYIRMRRTSFNKKHFTQPGGCSLASPRVVEK